ncbi:MAG: pyridoxamine 5'-phosphate oxidase family protein [Phyllobacteriaceae bacterium]|nr:pyridoxamine 5'-phosphate oxidase family protein [Phyllobacteriaceae bacterium]
MTDTASFPVTPRNRVKRMHERARYDRASVWAVLDAAALAHVAWVLDGQPFCTPTIHWRDGDRLYWHGSAASRMLRTQAEGLPVCLTVSHLDGLVLARTAFHHSVNYRSAMCFGLARLVDDPEEKARALDGLVDRLSPGRAARLRPTTAQELKATSVLAMDVEEASVKVRAAGVADDLEDLSWPVWAGVVPLAAHVGAVEPCPHGTAPAPEPTDLAVWREGRRVDDVLRETQGLWRPSAEPAEGA